MSTEPPQDTLRAALAWHAAGASVVRVATDGTKRPLGNWAAHQKERATEQQLRAWFTGGHPGLGIVCGAVSGGLEMLEFEGRAVAEGVLKEFGEIAEDSGLGGIWKRVAAGYLERSPSGGIHVLYRLDGQPVPGNTKLARRPARADELTGDERQVLANKPGKVFVRDLVETRGEGGFVVVAPSAGPVHETGLPYQLLAGAPETLTVVTAEEREALHSVARTLDTMPAAIFPAPADPVQEAFFRAAAPAADGSLKPGEDFEQRADWTDILTPHGWRLLGQRGRTRYWQRPGKNGLGISATTGHADDRDRLYVFSSSTEFDPERPYTKFAAHALLEHRGDYSGAAKELRRRGYGTAPERHLAAVPAQRDSPAAPPPVDGTAALKVDEPEPAADAGPYSFTDDGNALRLVDAHEHEIRYVPERSKWLIWEGHRWGWDEAGHVRELMKAIARDLPAAETPERRHRAYSLSARGTSASLQQACSDKRIVARASSLDSHRMELNTPGGVADLVTGELAPPDPQQMHTRSAAVAPEKMATPRWDAFLEDTFGGDAEMAAFVQRLAGYSASGDVRYQILPFLFGGGQNGKSVLMDVLRSLLGDYAAPAPAAFLMAGKNEHSAELAQLQGLRLVIASEVNQDARFDEAKMKELTGGEAIRARFMRQDFFTFEPTHHLWLMGNHQPEVKAGGDSFWRRLRLVPFLHKVPEHKKIENLSRLLVDEEGPGILAWVVQGAVDVFGGGLRAPESVMAATRAYADEEDALGRFLDACCMRATTDVVRLETKKLRAAYETWCHAEGETPLKPQSLGRELKRRGISRSDSNGRAFYLGLSLLAAEDEGWGHDND
ncbi:phage/plasmid primase, P4 family [Streptomyces rimosus]|uniref:phage/plasmid primase, P4 family n=1 Tax=Streptomyces rimosus TaxID=1927 RepID=UPI0004C64BF4|nr:phage/plasmid primase, P4 family [Streptomyces rimosus]